MSPRTQRAKDAVSALSQAPVRFYHVLALGGLLTLLRMMGFINPFDRIAEVEASLKEVKQNMVTKKDLQDFMRGFERGH